VTRDSSSHALRHGDAVSWVGQLVGTCQVLAAQGTVQSRGHSAGAINAAHSWIRSTEGNRCAYDKQTMRCGFFAGMAAVMFLAIADRSPGQTKSAESTAQLVLSELPVLDTAPDLASWRRTHTAERLKAPAYDNEYESQGLWCSASVADIVLPGGAKATRMAFFYVPPPESRGPLPAREDAHLVQQCRLRALWYQLNNPPDPAGLAKSVSEALAGSLGSPEARSRLQRRDHDWGSGYWNPYLVWERPDRRVVVAVDPGDIVPNPNEELRRTARLLIVARASQAPRGLSFDWSGALPKGQPSLEEAGKERNVDTEEIAGVRRLETPCAFDDGHNNPGSN